MNFFYDIEIESQWWGEDFPYYQTYIWFWHIISVSSQRYAHDILIIPDIF